MSTVTRWHEVAASLSGYLKNGDSPVFPDINYLKEEETSLKNEKSA